jgi:hypothetical protein
MDKKNIPATKALMYALKDRKKLEDEVEKLSMEKSKLQMIIRDLEAYKNCIMVLKATFSRE